MSLCNFNFVFLQVRRLPEPTAVLKEMAYILFYIKQGSSPCFSSLMETQNAKVTSPICNTSPISVLDFTGGAPSPSAEETSSSSSRVTPEKEEPGPCPTVSAEPVPAHPECNHSPSPSHTCDSNSHQQGAHNAMTSRFRAQHAKRPNPDHCVINLDNVFHDEQFGKASLSKALLRKELNGIPVSIISFVVRSWLLILTFIGFVILGLSDI